MVVNFLLSWVFVFQSWVGAPFLIEGQSMAPNLANGEIFLLNKAAYAVGEPRRGDIVVFDLPSDPGFYYVKRVIGLPGDHLRLEGSEVFLVSGDGVQQKLPEPFLATAHAAHYGRTKDYIVPKGRYFMMGDNRDNSRDSRTFRDPYVPEEHIIGKYSVMLLKPHSLNQLSLQGFTNAVTHMLIPSTTPGEFFPLTLQKRDGTEVKFSVEVADTKVERAKGLMFRTQMDDDKGMIFIYDKPEQVSFWMKNTLIPLDMIFINAEGKIIHIAEKSLPCKTEPCTLYPSGGLIKYVLELNGGAAAKYGITVGDKMVVEDFS